MDDQFQDGTEPTRALLAFATFSRPPASHRRWADSLGIQGTPFVQAEPPAVAVNSGSIAHGGATVTRKIILSEKAVAFTVGDGHDIMYLTDMLMSEGETVHRPDG
jgi:hypothetical protein